MRILLLLREHDEININYCCYCLLWKSPPPTSIFSVCVHVGLKPDTWIAVALCNRCFQPSSVSYGSDPFPQIGHCSPRSVLVPGNSKRWRCSRRSWKCSSCWQRSCFFSFISAFSVITVSAVCLAIIMYVFYYVFRHFCCGYQLKSLFLWKLFVGHARSHPLVSQVLVGKYVMQWRCIVWRLFESQNNSEGRRSVWTLKNWKNWEGSRKISLRMTVALIEIRTKPLRIHVWLIVFVVSEEAILISGCLISLFRWLRKQLIGHMSYSKWHAGDGDLGLNASAHQMSRALVSQLALDSRCIKYSVT